jgi:prevent-host-death family protein
MTMVNCIEYAFAVVDTLPISRFKATCLAALERVHRTGRPLLVTKRGVPIAQVIPAPPPEVHGQTFGAMRGTVAELDDVVAPLPESDGEAAR